jgi:DNA-binding SARP family transcriptional activator
MPSDVEIRVLGPLEMVGPRGPVVLHGYAQRTLLARLGVRPGETVARGALIDALWSDTAPAKATKTLHSHVAHLRREMREAGLPGLIATRDPGYALLVPAEAVDAVRFEILAARGRDALAAADAPAAAASLRAALGLWRGEALADCRPHDWIGAEITRLGELRSAATEDVIGAGRRCRPGDVYRRLRTWLVNQLGLEPSPRLQRAPARHPRVGLPTCRARRDRFRAVLTG